MTSTPRVALVTGASCGTGHETALALAAQNFSVFLAAEGTAAELAEAEAECWRRGAPDAAQGTFDLSILGEAERMVAGEP